AGSAAGRRPGPRGGPRLLGGAVLSGRPPPEPVPAAHPLSPLPAPPKEETMTSAVPTSAGSVPAGAETGGGAPLPMNGPDFPFAYDRFLSHPAGLGQVPAAAHGTEVAVIGGGLAGIVTAYELLRMGLRPVVYEADRIGGRLRSENFPGAPEDRKSTRLNSSHVSISYAVFC